MEFKDDGRGDPAREMSLRLCRTLRIIVLALRMFVASWRDVALQARRERGSGLGAMLRTKNLASCRRREALHTSSLDTTFGTLELNFKSTN